MKNKFFKKPFFTEYFLAPTSETFSLANIIESEKKTGFFHHFPKNSISAKLEFFVQFFCTFYFVYFQSI